MRGLGDHLSIGERIAFYRKRRGYTQEVLAGLVGRSTDWLAKIETGRRKPPPGSTCSRSCRASCACPSGIFSVRPSSRTIAAPPPADLVLTARAARPRAWPGTCAHPPAVDRDRIGN
ncbi:helix-turn-helix domain-containing protein [Streptomyces phaeochromogenes]|uniref:helix-turn-helix domain-containing protein n=1 Tax=Streptomyces phaeochromogenes TaxID=1923 RepID=UPI003675D1DF